MCSAIIPPVTKTASCSTMRFEPCLRRSETVAFPLRYTNLQHSATAARIPDVRSVWLRAVMCVPWGHASRCGARIHLQTNMKVSN